jgi:pimeloyl-ACP methyl ester carboxylesterase
MFRSERRAGRHVALIVSAAAVLMVLGACSFPSSNSSDQPTAKLSGAATPSPGVTDPATQPAFAQYYQQHVSWSGCGDGYQCARFMVPLDWSKPAGQTISIAATRLPASGSKLGSLVINPGGPGVSGISYAQAARQVFGTSILRNYDIVGFDPRGIGQSDPVACLPNSQLDQYTSEDSTPDTPSELAESVSEVKRFAAACEKNTGPLLEHVDTISAAKDMDVLRAVLGQSTLTYQGASYGTYLGAWYAELFPWRVGRMVLDGAVDPSISAQAYVDGQAAGFYNTLTAYVKDCQTQSSCPLHGSLAQAVAQVGTMVQRDDTNPLRTDDSSRPLTQALMLTGIAQALYAEQLWPALTQGLKEAMNGTGTGLLALADEYLERDSKGDYGQTISANPAIFCLDAPETRTPEQIEADAARLGQKYGPLGASIAWGALTCSQWPIKAIVPREKLTAEGAAPILVVGTTGDPATPYQWAVGLASQLSSGRLLTWEGTEHTAYHQGSTCIDSDVETYLLNGTLPAAGTRCK